METSVVCTACLLGVFFVPLGSADYLNKGFGLAVGDTRRRDVCMSVVAVTAVRYELDDDNHVFRCTSAMI